MLAPLHSPPLASPWGFGWLTLCVNWTSCEMDHGPCWESLPALHHNPRHPVRFTDAIFGACCVHGTSSLPPHISPFNGTAVPHHAGPKSTVSDLEFQSHEKPVRHPNTVAGAHVIQCEGRLNLGRPLGGLLCFCGMISPFLMCPVTSMRQSPFSLMVRHSPSSQASPSPGRDGSPYSP